MTWWVISTCFDDIRPSIGNRRSPSVRPMVNFGSRRRMSSPSVLPSSKTVRIGNGGGAGGGEGGDRRADVRADRAGGPAVRLGRSVGRPRLGRRVRLLGLHAAEQGAAEIL